MLRASLEQVACGDDGVHKGIRKGLLTGAGGQVIDDCYTFACRFAIRSGEEIASKHLDARAWRSAFDARFEPDHVARGPGETDHIAKPAIHQALYDARAYETR